MVQSNGVVDCGVAGLAPETKQDGMSGRESFFIFSRTTINLIGLHPKPNGFGWNDRPICDVR